MTSLLAQNTPTIEERPTRSCVAIRWTGTMASLGADLPSLTAEVADFLGERRVTPSGPPFWRYDVIDMAAELVVAVGFPVAEPVEGEERVQADTLPAGRYLTVSHVGHPDELEAVTGELQDWAEGEGLLFDVTSQPDGDHWGCRLEEYLSDPDEVPDFNQWETRLAFRLRD